MVETNERPRKERIYFSGVPELGNQALCKSSGRYTKDGSSTGRWIIWASEPFSSSPSFHQSGRSISGVGVISSASTLIFERSFSGNSFGASAAICSSDAMRCSKLANGCLSESENSILRGFMHSGHSETRVICQIALKSTILSKPRKLRRLQGILIFYK